MKRLTIFTIVAVAIALIGQPVDAEAQEQERFAFVAGEVELTTTPTDSQYLQFSAVLGIEMTQPEIRICLAPPVSDLAQAKAGFQVLATSLGVRWRIFDEDNNDVIYVFEIASTQSGTVYVIDQICRFLTTPQAQ